MFKGDHRVVRGKRNLTVKENARDLDDESETPDISDEDRMCLNSKLFLLTHSSSSGLNLYEHLSRLITNVLLDGPYHSTKELEDRSRSSKRTQFTLPTSLHSKKQDTPTELVAKAEWAQLKLRNKIESQRDESERSIYEDEESRVGGEWGPLPDVMRNAYYFEQIGAGLQSQEFFRVSLALADIVEQYSVQKIRFWGKIIGTRSNYYIAEADFLEGESENEESDDETEEENDDGTPSDDDTVGKDEMKPIYKKPVKIQEEPLGTGLNRKIYFVCSQLGQAWCKLPPVTPAQIEVARNIRHLFTGRLDTVVVSYPPFPGTERNYLRAQIARISSATQVSPLGLFKFDEEEGEEEAYGDRDVPTLDREFEGMPMSQLVDPGVASWCHHTPYILPQGRVTWFNPQQPDEEEEGEENEEEERNEPDEPEPEEGPPLLTPCSEDESTEDNPSWTTRLSSKFIPEYAIAGIYSSTWPGACAFAADRGKIFGNIYVGWGIKRLDLPFNPALPLAPCDEFPSGREITEVDDPTPEEEAAIQAAMREQEEGEEEGEEEEEEEEDGYN
ncbi:hypothetical protein ScPMuIL_002295 [Solemya velum]